ncbi:NADH-quinone oxidoreductase subunit M [Dactylosporangium aurantiacum]|uniref:NADH-quinone oxidoreductase subunit M n=1 Tax=Dactylosporangium aurantiacum TaxID=35754 RepID=A0A9Q9IK16_9ACTN|nr:NADH-quinone oxidoreductase subunit M [Dactylosporangium aurantiacum]MDG6105266.1 NADH-quinone oxidoreductase subunit M [Dactylosporangium aurantiacum]UWZ54180.1 NADH-quinone oxidoreductase subunit M [Dactylosporangium aurantiacum]
MSAGQTLLLALLIVPAIGALFAAGMPARLDRAARIGGTAFAAAAFGVALAFLPGAPAGTGARPAAAIAPWAEIDVPWAPDLSLRFHLGVDGISYPLVVLTAALTMLCCAYCLWRVPDPGRGRLLVALLLVLEVGIIGVFLALDLVLFFVFFEVVLLPMYAVIAVWGGDDRRRAARKFVLYTLLGSVLLLVGVFTVVSATGTADLVALTDPATRQMSGGLQLFAFVLLAAAFAVKSPLWPLHTWLPAAHTEAPTVGSVVLAGVLLKMGTYGLLRVAVGVAPDAAARSAPVLGILATAAIIVGGLVCLAQTELKRLIAYSSVGHMGFVLLGVATLTTTGFQAALIGNIAHGIVTGLLFFVAGGIKNRAHTGDLARLGGLRETAPALSGVLAFAAIASLGLPGLAGFWGEAFAVVAAFERGGPLWTTLGVLAAAGAALAAAYFLRLLRRVTHGAATPAVSALTTAGRLRPGELVAWSPLIALTLAVGVVPALVLGYSADPVAALAEVIAR